MRAITYRPSTDQRKKANLLFTSFSEARKLHRSLFNTDHDLVTSSFLSQSTARCRCHNCLCRKDWTTIGWADVKELTPITIIPETYLYSHSPLSKNASDKVTIKLRHRNPKPHNTIRKQYTKPAIPQRVKSTLLAWEVP